MDRPSFVLCPPDHFTVSYVINPWMDPGDWADNREQYEAAARDGWRSLCHALRAAGADIHLLPSAPGVPDLVFTANIAAVLDGKVMLARFRHPERRAEEPLIAAFFAELKQRRLVREIRNCPPGETFEGAGDAIFDPARGLIWMGHGPRTTFGMAALLENYYGLPVAPLKLVDPRFYHLDTAFCPLSGGDVIWFPAALDEASASLVRKMIPAQKLITIGEDDATLLAANAVCIERMVIAGNMTEALRKELGQRGYHVTLPPIGAFAKSGGSAYCLTLRLDRETQMRAAADPRAVMAQDSS